MPTVCLLCFLWMLTSCSAQTYETVQTTEQTYTRNIVCYGSIQASETWSVQAEKGAVLRSVEVECGDRVQQGDRLVTVEQRGKPEEYVAQYSGIVSELAAVGATSDGKKPFCTVTRTDSLCLSALLNERDICTVSVGDSVTVSGSGFPTETANASVERCFSLPEEESTGVYYRIRIRLPATETELLPGMSAKATIHSVSETAGIVVPFSAVGWDENGYYLYLADGRRVDLTEALACEEGYAVTGIEAGVWIARSVSEVEK